MKISGRLQIVLKDPVNQKLLNEYEFEELYKRLINTVDDDVIGEFSNLMFKIEINPLDYMIEIPKGFLRNSSISKVTIPDHINSIGRNAFYSCKRLKNIMLPNRITNISPSAFCNCIQLASIVIPTNVTSIDYGMFCGCKGLVEVSIPGGVTLIDDYAFDGCSSLSKIYFDGTAEQWKAIKKGSNWDSEVGQQEGIYTVYCTDGILNFPSRG